MEKLRAIVWTGVIGAAAVTCAAGQWSGFSLDPQSQLVIVPFLVAAVLFLWRSPDRFGTAAKPVAVFEGLLLFTVISAIGAVLSYVAMRNSTGFTDWLLDSWDRALGFRWTAILAVTERREWLRILLEKAYLACLWMPSLVFGLLYHANRLERMYRYLLAHGVALVITIALFWLFPARAAFAFYLPSDAALPSNARHYGGIIAGLRDGSITTIDLTNLGGIITFPSFHATMAVLFVWAAWPARRFRTPMVVVNALMWLAAVPIGGHYVVDLLGGSVIAALAIAIAVRIGQRDAVTPPTISAVPTASAA